MGRSHGDDNSDSLLVQPVRCRITKKHWEEWTTRPAFPSIHPPNLLSCTAIHSVESDLFWSNCIYEERQWVCGLTSCHGNALQGQAEGKGGLKRSLWIIESDYLVTYGWWLSVRHDKLCQTRITLSHFCSVYLSAFRCLTTPCLQYTHPSSSSVLVLVTSQTNFWGSMSSKVM